MKTRDLKNLLYGQVAVLGKALSSPKRLELIELLAQGEKPVELLATQSGMDMRLTSAHLRALREARLAMTRRDGKQVFYRLAGPEVSALWVAMRETAETRLVELRLALTHMAEQPDALAGETREGLLARARDGEVVVIDVRPGSEFSAGHLPFARSLPLSELGERLAELPADRRVVAYCRGPFCVMAEEAVALLRQHGFDAQVLHDGVSEWRARGLPVHGLTA